ncbi:hypothetical protein BP6252_03886 [Coleophoma cylindrospora]|uniref:protein disulfide-isomerase n=1 Tax=Coleophoma cylindrospora TaxID=1849047 RepID=A0A3D8S9J0_9HELO|nr:hypothetical protein BP6252_03886 [Coleophoma cylindrospora]
MVHTATLTAAAAALLCALPVQAGLYPKSSAVLSIDGKNYDRLIAQSNHTSIVEFYAPWCGHCKNLQPAYEKAAQNLKGLAKVAAVNCDEESNKQFCGTFGVQGFPTLKIVKPGQKTGRPIVEDYNGPRTAKGIVEAVMDKIPNLVKRVTDKDLETFLADANETPKALLFTDKGKTSGLLKAVAIDFKGSIKVAQIRNTDKASVELFGVTKFPTLVLLPGGKEAAEGIVYDGELKKDAIVAFLSQAATPNPDPAPPKVKVPKKKDSKISPDKAKAAFEKASKSHAKADGSTAGATATEEVLEDGAKPTESPSPEADTEKPVVLPDPAPAIPTLATEGQLKKECLGPKTGTCILAFTAETEDATTKKALEALAELAHKHAIAKRNTLPFFVVPKSNVAQDVVKAAISLDAPLEIVAINGRRGWWRKLPAKGSAIKDEDVTVEAIESWVDAIKMGEGSKEKLPEGLIPTEPEAPEPQAEHPIVVEEILEEVDDEPKTEKPAAEETKVDDKHDEL